MGVEASASGLFKPIKGFKVPFRGSYTFTHARFQSDFKSFNPQWGQVKAGDRLPYLPEQQLSLQIGIGQRAWEVNAAYRFSSAMRDNAGQDAQGMVTDAVQVLDIAAHYRVLPWLRIYAACNNVLDARYIVSHRPFGRRPGMIRFFTIGVKSR